MSSQLGKFVLGRAKGQAGDVGDLIGDHLRKERVSVEARAHGGAAKGEFEQVVQRKVKATKVGVELGHPARGFLTEGQRNGVHQVRTPDLHDVSPLDGFGVKGVAQGADARQEAMREGFSRSDVHGRGKGIVGRLRSVDVVVGVDWGFGAQHATGKLDGPVGDDLVGVHVGLRPATGLPHAKGKVVVEVTVDDVLRRCDDEVAHLGVELLEGHVGLSGGLLENAKSSNHAQRHGIVANVKVQQRTSGLAPVVAVGRDLEFAHRVGLNTNFAFRCFGSQGLRWRSSHGGRFPLKPLLNQASDGGGAAVCTAFADLPVQFFRKVFWNADAHDSAVAGAVFGHASKPVKAFNKYDRDKTRTLIAFEKIFQIRSYGTRCGKEIVSVGAAPITFHCLSRDQRHHRNDSTRAVFFTRRRHFPYHLLLRWWGCWLPHGRVRDLLRVSVGEKGPSRRAHGR